MTKLILPKATTLKMGAISTSLYGFLRHGIPACLPRAGLVQSEGETPSKGIYVGELMAYFSACAAFAQATSEVHHTHQTTMTAFVDALHQTPGLKPHMPELDAIANEVGLPVVLEIELGEDCEVLADTHFESENEAEKCWKTWRSVQLCRQEGIPAAWIKRFYFPRLLEFRDVQAARQTRQSARMLEQTTDSALMVGALMQSWHKDLPGDLLLAFKKQYGRVNFSQQSDFNETALERFFNLNPMIDPATRLLNQMLIWQDVDALAKKQGIPLQA